MFKLNNFTRIFMRFAPKGFLRYVAKKQGLDDKKVKYAMKLFEGVERVDIQSLPSSSGRGFIIYLDNKLSLFFYQDGDHFYFVGLEMGEYDKGDVTIFDRL